MKTKILSKTSTPVFAILALIIFGSTIGTAAPGDLDATFGSGGIVISTGGNINTLEFAYGMAIQSDGKIVVVGFGATGTTWDFAVVRYNTNGSPDTSFGGSGVVVTPVGNCYDYATSVAIQADGKIVVAGRISNFGGNCNGVGTRFGVVRYNPNGTLDTSFNGTGKVITSVGSSGGAGSIAIQTDGKIVVAGESDDNSIGRFTLVRYNTNGSSDTSFDNDGIVTTVVELGGIIDVNAVAIQADGKIVVAGGSRNFSIPNDLAVVRYNTDGSLDKTFNGTGKIITPGGYARSVAIQADGKIIAAGEGRLDRYNANGTPDTSFNGTGRVTVPIYVYSAAIQTDGKIIAAGGGGSGDFAAARLNPNGSPDTTFDFDGIVTTSVNVNGDFAAGVAIQADGKIVLAGSTDSGFNDFFDFAVVRFQGGSNANIRTRFDFDGDGRADISVFRPSDRIWYLNQSTNGFSAAQFGLSTDKITPADFDGDGRTDIAVYRDGIWYWLNSSNGSFSAFQFGLAGDIPVPADFTGDGRAELAVYRSGVWFTWNLATNQFNAVQFGVSSDKPVPADFDGDGKTDYAVYRPDNGVWYVLASTQGFYTVQFGIASDIPTVGDYDGDGKADQAVYREGVWYVLGSTQGFYTAQFGIATDIPTAADYDSDGKTDIGVYRIGNGTWYWLKSLDNEFRAVQFGIAEDKPISAAFVPSN